MTEKCFARAGRAYKTLFDYFNWTLIILVSMWLVVFFFFEVFACGANPSAGWSNLYSLRHVCVDTFAMQTGCAVFSWVMDLAILVEPLFMVSATLVSAVLQFSLFTDKF